MIHFFEGGEQRRALFDNKHSYLSYISHFERFPDEEALCLCPFFSNLSGPPSIIDFSNQLSTRIEDLHNGGVLPSIWTSTEVAEKDVDFETREKFFTFITIEFFGDDSKATMDEISIIEKLITEGELQCCDAMQTVTNAWGDNYSKILEKKSIISFRVGYVTHTAGFPSKLMCCSSPPRHRTRRLSC